MITTRKLNVLSLFDWISCARLALDRAGMSVDKYFASEIDKYAIQIAIKNYPDTIQVWSVVWYNHNEHIDLLIGWSPCQDLSIAKKNRKWLDWERSSLFWEYVRILRETKPKYFVLENVASMSKESKETITNVLLEIYPDTVCHMINASLVSAQNRKRLFWTNIQGIEQPQDRGVLLKDILEDEVDEKYYVKISEKYWLKWLCEDKAKSMTVSMHKWYWNDWVSIVYATENKSNSWLKFVWWLRNKDRAKDWKDYSRNFWQWDRIYSTEWKSTTLSANWWGRWAKTWLYIQQRARWFNKWWQHHKKSPTLTSNYREQNNQLTDGQSIRKLTPTECERLQWVPDGRTEWVSNTQRYKCLGNAFNVDVVAHILSYINLNDNN